MPKSSAPTHRSQKDAAAPDTGEAAAAAKNRQISARLQIIEGLRRLGVPHLEWPDFVRTFCTNPQERQGYHASISPPSFQPPDFERLHESPEQWAKKADAAWQKHRDGVLKQWQSWATEGVDEEIPPTKNTRGPGRKWHRLNAPLDVRPDWAARRLMGESWKEIAGDRFKQDQVRKGASELLKLAGWPTKAKPRKTAKVV